MVLEPPLPRMLATPMGTNRLTTSSLLKLTNYSGEICTQVYLSVSMMNSSQASLFGGMDYWNGILE